VENLQLSVLRSFLFREYPATELSQFRSALASSLLSFPCRAQLNCQSSAISIPLSQLTITYDWQFTANQFVLATSPLRPTIDFSSSTKQLRLQSLSNFVSDERMGLSITIAAGPRSAVILGFLSRGTHDHILLSQIGDSPNLKGQVPVFYIPQE
jgi:hypothetical protein